MTRRYSGFVLRCWDIGGRYCRIEIEHVQSGARTRVDSLDAAVTWIAECDAGRPVVEPSDVQERSIAPSVSDQQSRQPCVGGKEGEKGA